MRAKRFYVLALVILGAIASHTRAHPVPKDNHDRTIVVRLQKTETPNKIRVRVEYRLEVDEETVLLRDMRDYRDEVSYVDYFPQRPLEYYAHYTRIYAPVFEERLAAEVNEQRLDRFRCVSRKERLLDEDGKKLGHLRCDFVFETSFDAAPGEKIHFFFHDQTYLSSGIAAEPGQLVLSLVNETGLAIESKIEAEESVRKRPIEKLEPDEEDRLRKITIVLAPTTAQATAIESIPVPTPRQARESHEERFSLLRLILDDYGFSLTMLAAFLIGAAHALTPGHGKTLVAAYLVGERGTVWHALYLGLVTTLTHTGIVLALAAVLHFSSQEVRGRITAWIENGMGLVVGLVIIGMGFWLFLQRVAGRADHVHLDGGHHHHPSGQESPGPAVRRLSWWGITMLGVTGGMIPCWDAVGVLAISVGTNKMGLVLPAVLVFSAGLASVLVVIGILVVQMPRYVESRFGSGRLLRALPIVSAILVMLMGFWMCYDGVHGR
jgi:nickel/cobalt exporter